MVYSCKLEFWGGRIKRSHKVTGPVIEVVTPYPHAITSFEIHLSKQLLLSYCADDFDTVIACNRWSSTKSSVCLPFPINESGPRQLWSKRYGPLAISTSLLQTYFVMKSFCISFWLIVIFCGWEWRTKLTCLSSEQRMCDLPTHVSLFQCCSPWSFSLETLHSLHNGIPSWSTTMAN